MSNGNYADLYGSETTHTRGHCVQNGYHTGSNDQPDMQGGPTATLRPTRLKTRFYSDATLKLLADVLGDADGKA